MDVRGAGLEVCAICAVVAALAPAATGADHVPASDRTWSSTARPQAKLEAAGRGFRISALSGDGRIAAVADSRAVYLFRAPSEGSWRWSSEPVARLRVPRFALGNLAAAALSSDGTTALVAAGAVAEHQAAAYVFHVSSPGSWRSSVTPTATLTNATQPDGFGAGVALSSDGTTALVGESAGADVFHVATAGLWRDSSSPTARLVADPAGEFKGGLGVAVALSADGTTALIGVTSLETLVGAAYIFHSPAVGSWVSSSTPNAVLADGPVGLLGDDFGGAVSLSPDGRTALVGAPDVGPGPVGAAYFFRTRSSRDWTSTASPDAVRQDPSRRGEVPGWSVALSDEGTALVGEPTVLGGHGDAAVIRIARPADHVRLTDAAGPPADLYGGDVGLSSDGTTALVSSARAAVIYTEAGSRDASYCYVPYVEGEKMRAAKRAIESMNCRLGTVTRAGTPRGTASGCVISQTPPGSRLASGARVELKVGRQRQR
jgi:hypothetical protein